MESSGPQYRIVCVAIIFIAPKLIMSVFVAGKEEELKQRASAFIVDNSVKKT